MKRRPDARYNKQALKNRRRCLFGFYAWSLDYEPSSSAPDSRFSITPMNKRTLTLCLKYSQGHLPAEWNAFSAESARYFVHDWFTGVLHVARSVSEIGHFPSPRGHPRQRELRPQIRLPNKRGAMRRIPSRGSRLCIMPSPVCG